MEVPGLKLRPCFQQLSRPRVSLLGDNGGEDEGEGDDDAPLLELGGRPIWLSSQGT